jgi:hypothetical protein
MRNDFINFKRIFNEGILMKIFGTTVFYFGFTFLLIACIPKNVQGVEGDVDSKLYSEEYYLEVEETGDFDDPVSELTGREGPSLDGLKIMTYSSGPVGRFVKQFKRRFGGGKTAENVQKLERMDQLDLREKLELVRETLQVVVRKGKDTARPYLDFVSSIINVIPAENDGDESF